MNNNTYNGWTNEETWMVSRRYANLLLEDYIDNAVESVGASQVEEGVRAISDEAFAEVNWPELADSINRALEWEREVAEVSQ